MLPLHWCTESTDVIFKLLDPVQLCYRHVAWQSRLMLQSIYWAQSDGFETEK
jgi:hypothetical protein